MVSKKSKNIAKSKNERRLDIPPKTKKKSVKRQYQTSTKNYVIPKEKFLKALELVNEDIEWGNQYAERRCSVSIQHISPNIRQGYKNMSFKLLEEARLCVLQRDWKNLAKILTLAKPIGKKEHILFFQVFVRYAVICLAHSPDKNLLDMFMNGVASCSGEMEKQQFLNSLTND